MKVLIREFWTFARERKRFWLLPLIAAMVIVGGLILVTQTSAASPFIYSLF